MVVVIATIEARSGREEDLEQVLRSLVTETRREPGCLQYDLHVSADNPAAFALYERWESADALQAHFETEHMIAALGGFDELSEAGPVLARYELLK